jgi:subtilisin family serine protease
LNFKSLNPKFFLFLRVLNLISMKRLSLLLLLFMASLFAEAQIATNIYWVQFTDKNDSPYSIDNPEAYLSPRALQRRANLGITVDEYDIPVNPQYLQAVADCGAQLINPSKWLNGVSVYVTDLTVIEAINALDFVQVVRNCPNDLKAQEQKERWLANEMKPSAESNRGTRGYYGGAEAQVKQLNVDILHEMGFDGTGVIVAVLDGGFQGTEETSCFDNMREEGRLLGTRDFVYGSPSVYTQSTHGTSCLSTMAAYDPNNMVGTAPKASYYLIHTEDGDSENIIEEYNWVSGAEYADSLGVDVCSTSLGYIGFDMSQWDHPFEHFDGQTAPMSIGAEIAASRGMICMNAAGNEGGGTCTLGIPADAEHIVTVGAVDANGHRASFSSVGPTYDGRIKPDVMAMGEGTYVASGYGDWWPYYNGNGTSFATPVLAGAVACLRQARPYSSVQEICDVIRSSSDHTDNPDNQYGYGIPDFSLALELLNVEDPIGSTPAHIITVYPNPSNGDVHVVLNDAHKAELTVFDVMGHKLYSYSFNGLNHTSFERYLNTLNEGIYFINAVSESRSETLKFVVTK